jgi:hypothetical protein
MFMRLRPAIFFRGILIRPEGKPDVRYVVDNQSWHFVVNEHCQETDLSSKMTQYSLIKEADKKNYPGDKYVS